MNEKRQSRDRAEAEENIPAGIVGAFLGSLIGAACLILLSRLGYVAALSGVVMGLCSLKGYEKLGGKLSVRGIVLSCAVMAIMVYFADRADWAVLITKEYEAGLFGAFQIVPTLIELGVIDRSVYLSSLAWEYVFSAAGAAIAVVPAVKRLRKEKRDSRPDEE